MNRRKRTLIVLALAIVCATAATGGVLLFLSKQKPVEVLAPQIDVVVAARDVAMGICLTEDDLAIAKWPQGTPVKGAHATLQEVLKRGTIAGFAANEPVTDAKIAPQGSGCGLPPAIHPGMRAISVKVNEVIGVAGFVVPGALVDVLVTIRQNSESTSRIVVSNAEVLTAGTRIDQDQAKDGKPIPSTVVTLMVIPSDAERIALAAAEGQILLTLRNPLDKEATRTPGIRTASLLAGPLSTPLSPVPTTGSGPAKPRVSRAAAKPAQPVTDTTTPPVQQEAVPAIYVVDAIRAGKRAQEVIR
jgi:pilus assembly protein CpaB